MADTVGERIMQAVLGAMNAPADKPATTYRTALDAFGGKQIPAFVLEATSETVERYSADIAKHVRKFRIECLVRSVNPPVDPVADPLVSYAVQTVMLDESIGGLAKHLDVTGIEWAGEAAYENVGIATIDFEVTFYTKADDFTEVWA